MRLGQAAERVAVEVELVLVGDHEALAKAASGSAASSRSASSRLRAMPAPPSRAGSSGRCGRSGPRRARRAASRRTRVGEALRDLDRHDVVPPAVGEQGGDAERQPLDRRGDARVGWPSRNSCTTSLESPARRRARDRARPPGRRRRSRPPAALAGRRPGRQMAAGGVADRHDAATGPQAAWRGSRSRRSRPRASSGTPPPLPSRRYSMFHAAQPRARGPRPARPSASGRSDRARSRRG